MKKINFIILLFIILFVACNKKSSNNINNEKIFYDTLFFCGKNLSLIEPLYYKYNRDSNYFSTIFYRQQSEKFILFNLNKTINTIYKIHIKTRIKGLDDNFLVKIDTIFKINNENYYIFRLIDTYCYCDHRFDIVYAVTKNKGIVGKYLSDSIENKEQVMIFKNNFIFNRLGINKKEKFILLFLLI